MEGNGKNVLLHNNWLSCNIKDTTPENKDTNGGGGDFIGGVLEASDENRTEFGTTVQRSSHHRPPLHRTKPHLTSPHLTPHTSHLTSPHNTTLHSWR